MLKRLLVSLILATPCFAQLWVTELAPARAINWTLAGATIVTRVTNCTTQPSVTAGIGNAGANATSLQTAITAAIVQGNCNVNLPTGTFFFNTTMNVLATSNTVSQGNITIKGAGPNATFMIFTALGAGAAGFYMANNDTDYSGAPSNVAPWTAGYAQNATSITMGATTTGAITTLHAGTLLILDQLDATADTGNVMIIQDTGANGTHATEGGSGIGRPGLGSCTRLGAWSGATQYLVARGDLVSSGGVFYHATANSLNQAPPNASFWSVAVSDCRAQMQTVTVVSCTGANAASCDTTGTAPYTVVITPGLYAPNWGAGSTPGAWWSNGLPLTGIGLENLSIDAGALTGKGEVYKQNVTNSWVKSVRGISTAMYAHIQEYQSNHNTVQDSYFYGSPGASNSYGVDVDYGSCDNLVQNNIFQHIATATILEGGCGDVWGYNYAVDNYYTASGSAPNWQQGDIYSHGPNTYNLWEGHEGIEVELDDIHTSNFMETLYRSYISGYDPGGGGTKNTQTTPMQLYAWSRYHNILGNVFGSPLLNFTTYTNEAAAAGTCGSIATGNASIYNIGWSGPGGTMFNTIGACPSGFGAAFRIDNDTAVASSIMRWGNYDTKTTGVRFCTANGVPIAACTANEKGDGAATYPGLASPSTTLPASFYLSSKPSWWNITAPWPAVGPDISGGNISGVGGFAYHNPAAYCYLFVMGGQVNGSSGALPFTCNYASAAPGVPGTGVSTATILSGILLKATSVSGITPTRVSSNTGFFFNAASGGLAVGVSAGHLILYGIGWNSLTSTVAVSDNCTAGGSSNSYTTLNSMVTGAVGRGQQGWARVASSPAGGCTVTFTQTGGPVSLGPSVVVINDAGSVGVDVSTLQTQDSGACSGADFVTSGNITTTLGNDYLWSWTTDAGADGGTLTAGTASVVYTKRDSNASFPNGDEDGASTALGTYAGTWTQSTATCHQSTGVIAVKSH